MELSTHIEYLLLHKQQVSVPQLGTFVVKEMNSKRVDEEGIFLPPYRTVTFQHDEHESGEDFILSFSKLHNLARTDARMICIEYVDELMQSLEEDKMVSFGSMGYMIYNSEACEISFIPQQSGIAAPSYYGLDAVPFAKLSHEVRQQRAKTQAAQKVKLTSIHADHDTITIRINRRAFNYAASVAASIVLFFAIKTPLQLPQQGKDVAQKATTFLFSPKVKEDAKPESTKEVVVTSIKETLPQKEQLSEGSPYVIVLASAISEKSAISYAAQLKELGYNAVACKTGSMVRVVIPGFASEEEAYKKIHQSKAECNDFSQAWPLLVKGDFKAID